MRNFFLLCILCFCASGCKNFNITDIPGPQISTTVESYQKHDVFLYEYKVMGNQINHVNVTAMFVERCYSLSTNHQFYIDNTQSQLVIILQDGINDITSLNGVPQNWGLVGFNQIHGQMFVKYFDGNYCPSTIQIEIQPDMKIKKMEKINLIRKT